MKRFLTLLLTLTAYFTAVNAEIYSGSCGENLTWTLNTEDYTLTIEGSGDMDFGLFASSAPWAGYRSYIKYVSLPDDLTSIDRRAFSGCYVLTSVTIPDNVTGIGEGAFSSCAALNSVNIGKSVESIGDFTFSNCSNLISIEFPNSVTRIGSRAFQDCGNLTSVIIGKGLTTIADEAFLNSNNLTSFDVAYNNNYFCSADGVLFNKDKTILIKYPAGILSSSYSIPNSVTSIANQAFYRCWNLTSVTIPSSVTNIGNEAFYDCDELTSIEIPNGVTIIGESAFYQCNNLTSIVIPASVTGIGENAFVSCHKLTSFDVALDNSNFCSVDGVLFNKKKSVLIQYPVGKLSSSYSIPNDVLSIASMAFYGCRLKYIDISNSVTSIEGEAFSNCDLLTTLTCEAANPPTLSENVFYDVDKSIPLYVPTESLEAYKAVDQWRDFTNIQSLEDKPCTIISTGACGDNLLWGLTCDSSLIISGYGHMNDYNETSNISPWKDNLYVGYLYLPEYLDNIGQYAFTGCANLKSIYINNVMIGWAAFRGCLNLTDVQFGNNVCYIKNEAFQYCRNIKELNLPAIVSEIDNWAFSECTGLTQITCNATNPPEIYKYTFDHVDKHIPLYVPEESVDAYKAADHWKDFLNILSIEDKPCLISSGKCGDHLSWELTCDSLLVIRGEGAMTNWTSENEVPWSSDKKKITAVSLPSGLTNIGDFAFYECRALKSLTIPNSVTSIGNQSIRYCDSITTVSIGYGVASIGSWAFNGDTLQTAFVVDDNNSYFCALNGVLFTKDLTRLVQYPVGRSNTEYTIPDRVVSIVSGAFSYCKNLNSVTIPASVSEIESYAFFMCKNINTLTCKSVTPPSVGYNGFYAIDRSIPVYVHRKSIDAYQSAEVWEEFSNIQAIPTICTITYTDKNASIIDTEDMIIHLPEPPVFNGFTFVKWIASSENIVDGITIQAVYKADTPTSAPEVVTNPSNPAQKLIRNGNVYILTGDHTYTLTGQEIK